MSSKKPGKELLGRLWDIEEQLNVESVKLLRQQVQHEASSQSCGYPRQNVNARLSSQQNENARLSSQQNENARLSSQQNENARLSSQHNENARLSSQQNENARLSSQQNENARLSSQQNENARLMSQQNEKTWLSSSFQLDKLDIKLFDDLAPDSRVTVMTFGRVKFEIDRGRLSKGMENGMSGDQQDYASIGRYYIDECLLPDYDSKINIFQLVGRVLRIMSINFEPVWII